MDFKRIGSFNAAGRRRASSDPGPRTTALSHAESGPPRLRRNTDVSLALRRAVEESPARLFRVEQVQAAPRRSGPQALMLSRIDELRASAASLQQAYHERCSRAGGTITLALAFDRMRSAFATLDRVVSDRKGCLPQERLEALVLRAAQSLTCFASALHEASVISQEPAALARTITDALEAAGSAWLPAAWFRSDARRISTVMVSDTPIRHSGVRDALLARGASDAQARLVQGLVELDFSSILASRVQLPGGDRVSLRGGETGVTFTIDVNRDRRGGMPLAVRCDCLIKDANPVAGGECDHESRVQAELGVTLGVEVDGMLTVTDLGGDIRTRRVRVDAKQMQVWPDRVAEDDVLESKAPVTLDPYRGDASPVEADRKAPPVARIRVTGPGELEAGFRFGIGGGRELVVAELRGPDAVVLVCPSGPEDIEAALHSAMGPYRTEALGAQTGYVVEVRQVRDWLQAGTAGSAPARLHLPPAWDPATRRRYVDERLQPRPAPGAKPK